MLEGARAFWAQVHDDVENRRPGSVHQLALLRGRGLEVHPAHRHLHQGECRVGLRHDGVEACASNSCWQKARAKKPRESSRRSRSRMKARLSLVSVNIAKLANEIGSDEDTLNSSPLGTSRASRSVNHASLRVGPTLPTVRICARGERKLPSGPSSLWVAATSKDSREDLVRYGSRTVRVAAEYLAEPQRPAVASLVTLRG